MTLRADGLTVHRGTSTLLDAVGVTFAPGTCTALVGPNGAGKSTLLRALAGLEHQASGHVSIGDIDVLETPRLTLARHLSLMTQQAEPPLLRLLDVVLLGRLARLGRFGTAGDADTELARAALDELGIADLAERAFVSLSGGEQQRTRFAMQTVQDAPIALFDEPTSAQDFDGARRMISVFRRRAQAGHTIISAVHDLNLAVRGFDRLVCLRDGRVVADGVPDQVIRSEAVADAFGGALRIEESHGGPVVVAALAGT